MVAVEEAAPAGAVRVEASADARGRFVLELAPGAYRVRVRALGYRAESFSVELEAGTTLRRDVRLVPDALPMTGMVVTGTLRETYVGDSPVKVSVITPHFLRRTPASNLMESVQQIHGLYQQVDCGVCYTNNIRINGMEGPYTAVLIDGMPIMGALASVYGLNGINPSIIERVEIVKGPASTLYGTEAMGGVVNVVTKDPRFAPRMAVDAYASSSGELNLESGFSAGTGPLRGVFGGAFHHLDAFLDDNGDGFTDVPRSKRASLFGKMDYRDGRRRVVSLASKLYFEDRFGGMDGWSPARSGEIYGERILTRRAEVMGSLTHPTSESWPRLDVSASWHDQDSHYGDTPFAARQEVVVANLTRWWEKVEDLRLLTGASVRWQRYDDDTPATPDAEVHLIPAILLEGEYSPHGRVTALAGGRVDHHRDHGSIVSPRASVKFDVGSEAIFRLTAGTGFRVVNVFTEDHAALTGARRVVMEEDLAPERSVSVAANWNQVFPFGNNPMMLDVDVFHTRFSNRILPDYDADPAEIRFANLDGHAVSRGLAVALNQNFEDVPLLYFVGITWQDVHAVRSGMRESETFAPRYQASFGATLDLRAVSGTLDYSGSAVGPMRLPAYPPPFERPTRSRAYTVHHLQATWTSPSGTQIYGAVRNLTGFTQGSPLIDAGDPFGESFDTNYVWGPVQGRVWTLGMRWARGR